jgi:RNA polymerase sigma-B factor
MGHRPFRAPALAALDDRRLIELHRGGDPHARGVLIERYLPLVRSLALRYRRTAEPVDDLVQIASVGLIKAVDAWDPDRARALTTYAVPTILGELRRYFRDRTWAVRPPRALMELGFAAERAREPLGAAIGREPDTSDLAAHLGRTPGAVAEALQAAHARWAGSLDMPSFDDGGDSATVGEMVGGPDGDYEQVESNLTFERLTGGLTRHAREILRLRFEEDLCQAVIAARVGCSQMHVSRNIRASLEELAARVENTRFGYQLPRAAPA